MFQQVRTTFCALYDAREAAEAASDTAGPDTLTGEYAAAAGRLLETADLHLAAQDLAGATGWTRRATKLLEDLDTSPEVDTALKLAHTALRRLENLHR